MTWVAFAGNMQLAIGSDFDLDPEEEAREIPITTYITTHVFIPDLISFLGI